MFSDSYKIKLVDDVIYEVYGKVVSRTQGEIQIEGFNPSAEEADEGTDSTAESGVDIVLNSRLSECFAFGTKKDFTLYLKDYMKKWVITLPNFFPCNANGMRNHIVNLSPFCVCLQINSRSAKEIARSSRWIQDQHD